MMMPLKIECFPRQYPVYPKSKSETFASKMATYQGSRYDDPIILKQPGRLSLEISSMEESLLSGTHGKASILLRRVLSSVFFLPPSLSPFLPRASFPSRLYLWAVTVSP